jgi:hypothetical protein
VQEDAHRSDCAFGFTSYKDWQIRNEKTLYQWPKRNKLILIVISRFSLVNATMNAPCVCKLRKNCFTGIDQCAMVLSKKYKSLFQARYEFSPLTSTLVA